MKAVARIILFLSALSAVSAFAVNLKNESLGGLKMGASEKAVVAKYGKPEEIEGDEGAEIRTYKYPSKGMEFQIWFVEGRSDLRRIRAAGDSNAKTSRGIGVGSARKQVEAAYGKPISKGDEVENFELKREWVEYSTGEDVCPYQMYIVYESDKVVEISLTFDCS